MQYSVDSSSEMRPRPHGVPAYAIDEQTAVRVVDGTVDVISEGRWAKFGS